jgi:hypothetical protein
MREEFVMDFYVDVAVAVLLRLLKDAYFRKKYIPALFKVYAALGVVFTSDPDFIAYRVWSEGGKA